MQKGDYEMRGRRLGIRMRMMIYEDEDDDEDENEDEDDDGDDEVKDQQMGIFNMEV